MKTALLALLALAPACVSAGPVIVVQPLGSVMVERIQVVKAELETAFGVTVEILPERPLPKAAWYPPRKRWRAEEIVDDLASRHDGSRHRAVIGLTAADISVSKGEIEDYGIFGIAQWGGEVGLVSTFRLGAKGAGEEKLRERLRKLIVHEIGHVAGLEHCTDRTCPMHDAESGIAVIDAAGKDLCRKFREAVRRGLGCR